MRLDLHSLGRTSLRKTLKLGKQQSECPEPDLTLSFTRDTEQMGVHKKPGTGHSATWAIGSAHDAG